MSLLYHLFFILTRRFWEEVIFILNDSIWITQTHAFVRVCCCVDENLAVNCIADRGILPYSSVLIHSNWMETKKGMPSLWKQAAACCTVQLAHVCAFYCFVGRKSNSLNFSSPALYLHGIFIYFFVEQSLLIPLFIKPFIPLLLRRFIHFSFKKARKMTMKLVWNGFYYSVSKYIWSVANWP